MSDSQRKHPDISTTTIATPVDWIEPYDSDALVQIVSPGEGSRVTSPILVVVNFDRSHPFPLILELRGSDGRLLVRQIWSLEQHPDACTYSVSMPFEIGKTPEAARLLVTQKDEFRRLMSVHSVDLTLITGSEEEAHLNTSPAHGIVIKQPDTNAVVSGDVLTVSGRTCLPVNEPLRVLLIDENGKVVGQRLAEVKVASGKECVTFSSEVPFFVDEPTGVRLIVYQDGNQLSAIQHLSSLVLTLEP